MFKELIRTVRVLRRRCPWDRKQTVATTRPLLLNETYELDDALRRGNAADIAEELGDYLFLGLFLAEILRPRGITLSRVIRQTIAKLKGRHPHIYGKARLCTADAVLTNWEKTKRREKNRRYTLDGIPATLPALRQAQLIQERCRRVGFDWDNPLLVLDKVEEEIRELRLELTNQKQTAAREEAGDLLFAMVNLCRHIGIDAEQTLRDANRKFVHRFNRVERTFRDRPGGLATVSLAEMEAVWQEAKRAAGSNRNSRPATRRQG